VAIKKLMDQNGDWLVISKAVTSKAVTSKGVTSKVVTLKVVTSKTGSSKNVNIQLNFNDGSFYKKNS